jgi:hypothetical protein
MGCAEADGLPVRAVAGVGLIALLAAQARTIE